MGCVISRSNPVPYSFFLEIPPWNQNWLSPTGTLTRVRWTVERVTPSIVHRKHPNNWQPAPSPSGFTASCAEVFQKPLISRATSHQAPGHSQDSFPGDRTNLSIFCVCGDTLLSSLPWETAIVMYFYLKVGCLVSGYDKNVKSRETSDLLQVEILLPHPGLRQTVDLMCWVTFSRRIVSTRKTTDMMFSKFCHWDYISLKAVNTQRANLPEQEAKWIKSNENKR